MGKISNLEGPLKYSERTYATNDALKASDISYSNRQSAIWLPAGTPTPKFMLACFARRMTADWAPRCDCINIASTTSAASPYKFSRVHPY